MLASSSCLRGRVPVLFFRSDHLVWALACSCSCRLGKESVCPTCLLGSWSASCSLLLRVQELNSKGGILINKLYNIKKTNISKLRDFKPLLCLFEAPALPSVGCFPRVGTCGKLQINAAESISLKLTRHRSLDCILHFIFLWLLLAVVRPLRVSIA